MDFEKVIRQRASIRNYSDKKVDSDKIMKLIEAANLAPSPDNLSILRFIIVEDKEKITKIAQACQQPFVGTAHYIIVACSDPTRTTNAYGKPGENYVRQQAGAALQNFLLKIEESGLSTCWVGYFSEDLIKRALNIPDHIQIEAVFPIGFEYEKKRTKKSPIDLDRILYFNKWDQKKMNPPRRLNV